MKLFIRIIVIVCFLYNFAFAATLRTMVDLQIAVNQKEAQFTPVNLKKMTLAELTEIEI